LPTAKDGTDDEENLWLSCRLCNGYKGVQTEAIDPQTGKNAALFNPRTQSWNKHFKWNIEEIIGKTACGRGTVQALKLNNEIILPVRKKMDFSRMVPADRLNLRKATRRINC